MAGCGLARQLVQVRNDDRLDPHRRPALQVQLLLVLPGFPEVPRTWQKPRKTRTESCSPAPGDPALCRRALPYCRAPKARRNLLMFMLALSLDGFLGLAPAQPVCDPGLN